MKIYYWSPYFSKVATVKSVLNSLNIARGCGFKSFVINSMGEWSFINKKKRVDLIGDINIHKILPNYGFYFSKFHIFLIYLLNSFSLFRLIKKSKNSFFIIHLVTSLPLILNFFIKNNNNNKFILRISGLPKLNIFRKFLWKNMASKCFLITSPTIETKERLIKEKIFPKSKIKLLRDPVFRENKNKKIKKIYKRKNFLAVGRLTKQKNYIFLIYAFKKLKIKYPEITLTILGDGEQYGFLRKMVDKNKLNKCVIFKGYVKNVQFYYQNYDCLLVPSLWEDPGFILIEAGKNNLPIISSNCFSGPTEILKKGKNGYLFKLNDYKDFEKKFDKFMNDENKTIYNKVKNLNHSLKEFSFQSHQNAFKRIIKSK